MSKNLSSEIAIELVYYLVIAKSSEQDYKYFKPKLMYNLHKRDSIWVDKTWWVKVPRKYKNIKNRKEEEGETPIKGIRIRKPTFFIIEKRG